MPFPMKIQPIDARGMVPGDQTKPVPKSRLKRLFERQFPGVARTSSVERLSSGGDLEPSSICLDKMVRNFMEDNNEKSSSRCGRSRCNCFHGTCDGSSDDDLNVHSSSSSGDASIFSAAELLKGFVVCASLSERNLLADASSVIDKCRNCKRKDEHIKAVADGLRSVGYDASTCKSRWEKSLSFPAGEHEYIDVIVAGERLLLDVDFRSEFQIARSTKIYDTVLQSLPPVFVGKEDRLSQIVAVVSEAARLSLKKKGLHFPPWRKPEYMRSKWLAPYERSTPPAGQKQAAVGVEVENEIAVASTTAADPGDANGKLDTTAAAAPLPQPPCEPTEVKPKPFNKGENVVTGLAFV